MAKLILVRHGKSQYNAQGIWTGWDDPELHDDGRADAKRVATELVDFEIHKSYSSGFKRTRETLEIIKQTLNLDIPHTEHEALNERHYGDFTGKNKWQVKEEVGEETFQLIRRSWDYPIPNGESMAQVYDRIVPYFEQYVLEDLKQGMNVILVSSGNALRALVKYLENLSNVDLANLEVGIAEAHIYEIDQDGKVVSKEVRAENALRGKI